MVKVFRLRLGLLYIYSTCIPSIMIMNRMYENQNLVYIVPLTRHTIVLCIRSINPIAKGCFICVNINLVIVRNSKYNNTHHQRTSLI